MAILASSGSGFGQLSVRKDFNPSPLILGPTFNPFPELSCFMYSTLSLNLTRLSLGCLPPAFFVLPPRWWITLGIAACGSTPSMLPIVNTGIAFAMQGAALLGSLSRLLSFFLFGAGESALPAGTALESSDACLNGHFSPFLHLPSLKYRQGLFFVSFFGCFALSDPGLLDCFLRSPPGGWTLGLLMSILAGWSLFALSIQEIITYPFTLSTFVSACRAAATKATFRALTSWWCSPPIGSRRWHAIPWSGWLRNPVSVVLYPFASDEISDTLFQECIISVLWIAFLSSLIGVNVIPHSIGLLDLSEEEITHGVFIWDVFHSCNDCVPIVHEWFQVVTVKWDFEHVFQVI